MEQAVMNYRVQCSVDQDRAVSDVALILVKHGTQSSWTQERTHWTRGAQGIYSRMGEERAGVNGSMNRERLDNKPRGQLDVVAGNDYTRLIKATWITSDGKGSIGRKRGVTWNGLSRLSG